MLEFLLLAGAGLSVSIFGYYLKFRLRWALQRRRARRVKVGRALSFPASVTVAGGRERRARVFRSGDQMYVRLFIGGFVFDAFGAGRGMVTESGWIAGRELAVDRVRFRADDDRTVQVGLPPDDVSLLVDVMAGPSRDRPRFAAPALALAIVFGVVALAPGVFALASYDARAQVVSTDAMNYSCQVRWTHGGHTHVTGVDCTDDSGYPAPVGTWIDITAQYPPFDGQAVAGPRSDAIPFMAMLALPALASLVVAAWRARGPRRPVRLTPVAQQTDVGPVPLEPATGLPDLVRVVQDRYRLAPGGSTTPDRPWTGAVTLWRLTPGAGWVWAGAFVSGLLVRVGPDEGSFWIWIPVLAGIAYYLLRLLTTYRAVRALATAPATSEWDGLAVTDDIGAWMLLLVLGDHVHWLVPCRRQPPIRDRWTMFGEPGDGLVRLVAQSDGRSRTVVVERVDDALAATIRRDLTSRLDGAAVDRAT